MNKTGISWTDFTWNPVSGCNKVSPGCQNCYAEAFKIAIYEIFFGFLLIGTRITLHFYISKVIRDQKREKERVGQ